jgi:hypothetical protein
MQRPVTCQPARCRTTRSMTRRLPAKEHACADHLRFFRAARDHSPQAAAREADLETRVKEILIGRRDLTEYR